MTAPRPPGDDAASPRVDPSGASAGPSGKPIGVPGPRDPALRMDPAQLARLGSLPIQARVIVEGALSGLHRAAVHGASVEFAEHKEYSPGDELRHVDWKAYAKLDRYYVKQFEQESQLTVYLVLDASTSMSFSGGGIAKLAYGGMALAALAYLVIQQQDKVGLLACGDKKLPTLVPPRARTNHLHDLMSVLESILARGGTGDESPAAALIRIAELTRRRRALIVLASDLFDADDHTLQLLMQLRAQRHDVSVLHILDPHERHFPYDGLTQFESLETSHKLLVNPAAIRRDYLDRMEAFLARTRGTLTAAGVDYHLAETNQPLEQTLLELLVTRSRLGPGRRAG
ncbi:MAG TPA: DUF58 domain-containing protein [Kofleriaceae bacterium]|nr:DUF58 domain-containing protein [Kofleriaceae bacterium]